MKVRRDILLFSGLALAAVGVGWFALANRPGAAIDAFESEAKAQAAKAKPNLAPAEAFRATVCAASPCVMVEAGGLAFLVGAGGRAAEELAARGLMRADLDAVVLTDLSLRTVEGLPTLAGAVRKAGRTDPLIVYAPAGALPVVDGANLMLAGEAGTKLALGPEGENQGLSGQIVFDSGVVSIRAFPATGEIGGRVYRFDFDGRSLVVSGCGATQADVVAAARGTKQVAAVLAAASSRLIAARGTAKASCLEADEAAAAMSQAKLSVGLLAPLYPAAESEIALRAWGEVFPVRDGINARPGGAGWILDLGGETPSIRSSN